jgi:hypothetical protein
MPAMSPQVAKCCPLEVSKGHFKASTRLNVPFCRCLSYLIDWMAHLIGCSADLIDWTVNFIHWTADLIERMP